MSEASVGVTDLSASAPSRIAFGPIAARPAMRRAGPWSISMILLFAAMLARWRMLGNPLVHVDEQFYLLVGDRMLHGAIPYVDIWDRKPIGVFLLFAGLRLLGGSGVWQYQIAALCAVTATALILYTMARRVTGQIGALAAGLLYVVATTCAGGEGGQAPVWYNLPVAAAIAILLAARDRPAARDGDLRLPGAAIMALFGIALQIKYSAVFEGMFAGIVLLGTGWRRGRPIDRLAVDAALWIAIACLPTLLAAAGYVAIGHGRDWLYANIVSIMNRGPEPPAFVRHRLIAIVALIAPFVLAVPLRRWTGARPASPTVRRDLRLFDGWAASALLGVVLFGTWFTHYALPLLVPMAITAAPLAESRAGRTYLAALLVAAAGIGQLLIAATLESKGDAAVMDQMTRDARPTRGCLFVYDGPPMLYQATGSCLPSTHIFPSHLHAENEIGATGIDETAEVRRIMATRPATVVTTEPAYPGENPAARAAFYAGLRGRYDLVGRYGAGARKYAIYRRDDTGAPLPSLTVEQQPPGRGPRAGG